MAQVSYRELNPDITVIAKGCPNPTILRAVQAAAREFCNHSEAYIYTIPATDVPLNATAITIVLPDETEILRPMNLRFDGRRLYTTNEEAADAAFGEWDNVKNAATPTSVMRTGASTVALVPIPGTAVVGGLTGRVALTPTRLAAGIEETFLDEYGDGIADGAIARLSGQKGTDWYAPDISSYYEGRFRRAIFQAGLKAKNRHTENAGTVAYGGI